MVLMTSWLAASSYTDALSPFLISQIMKPSFLLPFFLIMNSAYIMVLVETASEQRIEEFGGQGGP